MCVFFLHELLVKAKRVCVTCLGWWCRGGSHGLLSCVMSVPCLIGDQLGQMQRESFAFWPHLADLCHPFSPLSCNHISHWPVSLHKQLVSIYRADYMCCTDLPSAGLSRYTPDAYLIFTHFLPIALVRSLIRFGLTRTSSVWSGSFISYSEGFCSSRQMCSHVEIITYLLVVFIVSPHRLDHYILPICSMTALYYANAYSNGLVP